MIEFKRKWFWCCVSEIYPWKSGVLLQIQTYQIDSDTPCNTRDQECFDFTVFIKLIHKRTTFSRVCREPSIRRKCWFFWSLPSLVSSKCSTKEDTSFFHSDSRNFSTRSKVFMHFEFWINKGFFVSNRGHCEYVSHHDELRALPRLMQLVYFSFQSILDPSEGGRSSCTLPLSCHTQTNL